MYVCMIQLINFVKKCIQYYTLNCSKAEMEERRRKEEEERKRREEEERIKREHEEEAERKRREKEEKDREIQVCTFIVNVTLYVSYKACIYK